MSEQSGALFLVIGLSNHIFHPFPMSNTVQTISLVHLSIVVIPVLIVFSILWRWSLGVTHSLHAIVRMLVQLLLIGYLLTYIFESDSVWIVGSVLMVMVLASSWIALNTIPGKRWMLYRQSLIAVLVGGGVTLCVVTEGVLQLDPWYAPQYMIPLAGMIFANSMNSVSLAAERFYSEWGRAIPYTEARNTAFQAAMIPVTNSLFAVGLVSLPGMMTGQILSGVSPPIAARYQIMVMCMVFASAGISAALFLVLIKSGLVRDPQQAQSKLPQNT